MQVNAKAGLTFASALRSILRSDPDVVLLGEIRDHETAQIAIEAALTGHLVLSTLHTNDAPSAVVRLTEMDIEPFLVGSALDCVVAQRLARRLCERCKEPYQPSYDELNNLRFAVDPAVGIPVLHRPVGCQTCSNTGYRGRLALHEVMAVSEEHRASRRRTRVERGDHPHGDRRGDADTASGRLGESPDGPDLDRGDPPCRRLMPRGASSRRRGSEHEQAGL